MQTLRKWWQGLQKAIRYKPSKRNTENAQDRSARITAHATIWMVVIALVTALIGIAQWKILSRTLDEMRAQDRAWVSFELRARSGMPVYEKGASLLFDVIAKNRGHLPALNVQTRAAVLAAPPSGAKSSRKYTYGRTDCHAPFNQERGVTVFPDETSNLGEQGPSVSREAINAVQENNHIALILVVCVVYRTAGSDAVHRTWNTFIVGRHWFPENAKNGLVIPQEDRYLFKSDSDVAIVDFDRFGTGETAD